MSTYSVKSGDVLLVPASTDALTTIITLKWHQSFSDKSASYHTALVDVKGKPDAKVLFFIASEWYTNPGAASPGQHISKVATKAGQFYELKIDDKVRYGQKNAQGEARFIVYHDTSRHPFQHRFVSCVLLLQGTEICKKVAEAFKVSPDIIKAGEKAMSCFLGDELRKF